MLRIFLSKVDPLRKQGAQTVPMIVRYEKAAGELKRPAMDYPEYTSQLALANVLRFVEPPG